MGFGHEGGPQFHRQRAFENEDLAIRDYTFHAKKYAALHAETQRAEDGNVQDANSSEPSAPVLVVRMAFRCWGGLIWARSGENGVCYQEALWTCNLASAILCRFTCIRHAFCIRVRNAQQMHHFGT